MAKFSDMRKFVALVCEQNKRRESNKISQAAVALRPDQEEYYFWPPRDNVVEELAKKLHITKKEAHNIWEDTEDFGYTRLTEKYVYPDDFNVIVTSTGRHLLVTWLKLPTGVWREWARDNDKRNALLLAVIGTFVLSPLLWGAIIGGFKVISGTINRQPRRQSAQTPLSPSPSPSQMSSPSPTE